MKITESRLRRLIRQVIRESVTGDTPTPGDILRATDRARALGDTLRGEDEPEIPPSSLPPHKRSLEDLIYFEEHDHWPEDEPILNVPYAAGEDGRTAMAATPAQREPERRSAAGQRRHNRFKGTKRP